MQHTACRGRPLFTALPPHLPRPLVHIYLQVQAWHCPQCSRMSWHFEPACERYNSSSSNSPHLSLLPPHLLQVQAWHCPQCSRMTEHFDPACKGHGAARVRTTKRFWTCSHCNHYLTTLGVIHPKRRCPK